MSIWLAKKWEKVLPSNCQSGLYIRYDSDVDQELKSALMQFVKWLRVYYKFPMRVRIYVKSAEFVKSKDGDRVYGTFWGPNNKSREPHIKIATGDYIAMKDEFGPKQAINMICWTLSHELTHYFQWINGVILSPSSEEKQASLCARYVVEYFLGSKDSWLLSDYKGIFDSAELVVFRGSHLKNTKVYCSFCGVTLGAQSEGYITKNELYGVCTQCYCHFIKEFSWNVASAHN